MCLMRKCTSDCVPLQRRSNSKNMKRAQRSICSLVVLFVFFLGPVPVFRGARSPGESKGDLSVLRNSHQVILANHDYKKGSSHVSRRLSVD